MVSIPVMVLSFKCTYPHSQWRGCMVLIRLILDSENNVFSSVSKPVFAEKGGCACLVGNDLGGKTISVPQGTCFAPSDIRVNSLDDNSSLKSIVTSSAGAKLSF